MEVPVELAMDTAQNWEHSDTVLGESELFLEDAGEREDEIYGKVKIKHLLIGDGKPAGPGMARLRATPELIKGLPETLQELKKTDENLQHNIVTQPTIHDETLKGKGIKGDPLSVKAGSFDGITSGIVLKPDGIATVFSLPEDFMVTKIFIVTINGIGQGMNEDYTLDEETKAIVFTERPEAGDRIIVYYTTGKDINLGEDEK